MASRYNQLTMLYIFNILKLDASPKKPYSAPMVHRRLKELGIGLYRCRKEESRENVKENGMESSIKSSIESDTGSVLRRRKYRKTVSCTII